jgi:integrase
MVLSMTRPTKRPRSAVYRARKVVPQSLRGTVGKRELVETLGTRDPAEAKRLIPAVMARFDAILTAARAEMDGKTTPLSSREVAEIAGEVYREAVRKAEAAPGTVKAREHAQDALLDRLEGDHGDSVEDQREFNPTPDDVAEAQAMLAERGVATDAETLRVLARAIFSARTYAASVAIRRAADNWSSDPDAARFPVPSPRVMPPVPLGPTSAGRTTKLTTVDLLRGFAADSPQQPKTMVKREAALRHLEAAAGHGDAGRIGKPDILAMKTARLAKVSAATVTAEIGSLRPVWAWGIANGVLPEGANPFAGMSPRGRKTNKAARLPFDEPEAAMLLEAARRETGWLRWVPWVLAFTGARLSEVSDAHASDVRQERGVWVLAVHEETEGRTIKTRQSQRLVPLADALIHEGFVAYARSLPAGSPLFSGLAVGTWGKRSSTATKRLGRWMRGLGLTDPRKVAGHSWRHRMKDRLRFARVPAEAADAILGHDNPVNAGSGYGDGWRGRPDELAAELARVPLVPEGLVVGPSTSSTIARVDDRTL